MTTVKFKINGWYFVQICWLLKDHVRMLWCKVSSKFRDHQITGQGTRWGRKIGIFSGILMKNKPNCEKILQKYKDLFDVDEIIPNLKLLFKLKDYKEYLSQITGLHKSQACWNNFPLRMLSLIVHCGMTLWNTSGLYDTRLLEMRLWCSLKSVN